VLQETFDPTINFDLMEDTQNILHCIVVSTFLALNDQGGWRAMACRGHCPACPFKTGATGAEVFFHNNFIGNFMVYQNHIETNLLRLYSHTQKIQNVFLCFLLLFLMSTLLLNRNKHNYNEFFVFL